MMSTKGSNCGIKDHNPSRESTPIHQQQHHFDPVLQQASTTINHVSVSTTKLKEKRRRKDAKMSNVDKVTVIRNSDNLPGHGSINSEQSIVTPDGPSSTSGSSGNRMPDREELEKRFAKSKSLPMSLLATVQTF